MSPVVDRLLVVGTSTLARKILNETQTRRSLGYTLLGVVAEASDGARPSLPCDVVGSIDDLPAILARLEPRRLVVALDESEPVPVAALLRAKMLGIAVERGEDFCERLSRKISIESLDSRDFVLAPQLRWSRLDAIMTRVLNAVAAAAALIAFVPLLAFIAAAILLDSGRPVLFVQERVGLGGRPFRLMKFRTMSPGGVRRSEWAGDNAHRVTRTGRWLRKFRLDELPQLFNVLRGDMNFVGPRPHPLSNFEMLATVARNVAESGVSIPYYLLRSSVHPGITGWAQVRYGYANDIVQEIEKLRYDLYYVKHRSLWLDLRIVAETLRVVFTGRESEEVHSAKKASARLRAG